MRFILLNFFLAVAAATFGDTVELTQTRIHTVDGSQRPHNRRPSNQQLTGEGAQGRAKLRTHMFRDGGGAVVSHGFHLSDNKGPKVFCTAVFRNEADLIVETSVALRQCDGFAIVSNHTTTIDETKKHLRVHEGINGTMDAKKDQRWGNPANTFIFKQLWDFLAQEHDIKEYDWIVKIDPDTFLRPEKLRLLFKRHTYKSSVPMIVSHRPNSKASMESEFSCCDDYDQHMDMWKKSGIRGGFCMLSRAFFNIYRNHGCRISHEYEPAEDIWWDRCMETRPYRKAMLAQPERQCIDTIFDAHMYHPVGYNLTQERRAPMNPYMLRNIITGEELFHKQGFCISPDIIAIHPVKDPAAHRLLREQLSTHSTEGLSVAAMEKVFYPVQGWTILPEDAE